MKSFPNVVRTNEIRNYYEALLSVCTFLSGFGANSFLGYRVRVGICGLKTDSKNS